jgi:TolA-binding protein
MFRLTPQDTSLSRLASAIEGMEQKALAQEYTYRRKEHFQAPLAAGLMCLVAGLMLPLPRLRRTAAAARAAVLCMLWLSPLRADAQVAQTPAAPQASSLVDELLLRPRRATAEGRAQYERGNHPQALAAFERATASRPRDLAARFNLADGLYKNGRYDEAGALYRALGADAGSPVAEPSRFNLGNSLYQKQDYRGAAKAYREALRLRPDAEDARRNLELALRALREQEQQKKQQEQQRDRNKKDQDQDQDKQQQDQDKKQQEKQDSKQQPQQNRDQKQQNRDQGQDQKGKDEQKPQPSPQPGQDQQQPRNPQEQADQRFRQEAGMPRERAMQLLDALQQNEKAEQKKLLALKRAQRKKGKDW